MRRVRVRIGLAILSALLVVEAGAGFASAAAAGAAVAPRVRLGSRTASRSGLGAVPQVPPASSLPPVLWGAATETGLGELPGFEADAGKRASLFLSYSSFANDSDFPSSDAAAVVAHGATPVVTWEPWDPASGSASQPAYRLSAIISGADDAYITRWANEVRAFGHPIWLRFAHEMNGDWYPWAESVNGNAPGQYVAAWRHVHDLFAHAGATNVAWIWTPNVVYPGTTALAELYPGDAYVNWVGVDGYNWGSTRPQGWQSPEAVFGETLSALRQLSSRPIVIGETASAEAGGSKAAWINQFFATLAAHPEVRAFLWFNLNKETDWRIESSPAATQAFAQGIANPRFQAG
jgi:hypothetical protein